MSDGFVLDPRLEAESVAVADWPLSTLRLRDDARFHWLLVVPRRVGLVELTDLDADAYAQLASEILAAVRLVQDIARPDKVNVAALGNLVPQLHVHVQSHESTGVTGASAAGAGSAGAVGATEGVLVARGS